MLIGVEETIPRILRQNIKTGLFDWASCVFATMLLYGLAFIDEMISVSVKDVPYANFEVLVYVFAGVCLLFRFWQLGGRNTDMPKVHMVGFAAGEVIGFILFKLHLDSLLTFTFESLMLYSVRIVVILMLLYLISMLYKEETKDV